MRTRLIKYILSLVISLTVLSSTALAQTALAPDMPKSPIVIVDVTHLMPQKLKVYADGKAREYGLNPNAFVGTLVCESRLKWDAVGAAGEIGVAQIHPPSHPDLTKEQMLDPYFSIDWMAVKWSQGYARLWTCWRNLYG